MQYQHIGYRIKGFYKLNNYAIKYGMNNETAKHRQRALRFWQTHGIEASLDAFKVCRSTLYRWHRLYNTKGVNGLVPGSHRPKNCRQRQWNKRIINQIKALRHHHPNLGKDKIYPLLKEFCKPLGLATPSASTIGRIINDEQLSKAPLRLTDKGRLKQYRCHRVLRKPKYYKAKRPGECVGLDTMGSSDNA